jgi:transposase
MIRIDAAWLATAPLDMRAGTDTALARVIATFGAAHPHHAYVFANQRANRLKVLVHDGVGLWLAARRLHQGKFVWVQAPVPAHVIDKGLPTTALLADVLVGKYAEHLPLYRQEFIYARAGVPIARSTLSAWVGQCGVALQPLVDTLTRVVLAHVVLHADETPVQMLKPGSGKTHHADIWAYSTGPAFEPLRAVVYDFCTSRGGLHAREFLSQWKGQLVCDDYAAYKDLFRNGVTEVGCLAHARRKFFELHEASKSTLVATALESIQKVYAVERLVRDASPAQRLQARQHTSRPVTDAWHEWMTLQRIKLTDSSPSLTGASPDRFRAGAPSQNQSSVPGRNSIPVRWTSSR